jgi:methionyl aminopeptidase
LDIKIKSSSEIEKMTEAGRILAEILDELFTYVRPGISTYELDTICEKLIKKNECLPILKGYEGFPSASCISVNDQVGHGIPHPEHFLDEGDIVKIDTSISYNGWCADAARTIPVGKADPLLLDLIENVKGAFYAGLEKAVAGNQLNEIGRAIEEFAVRHDLSVVRDMMGHGIGQKLHEDPPVPHFKEDEDGPLLLSGMTLAIEPMLNMGDSDVVWGDDDWTVYTADYSFSAHYENTILITDNKPVILTPVSYC